MLVSRIPALEHDDAHWGADVAAFYGRTKASVACESTEATNGLLRDKARII